MWPPSWPLPSHRGYNRAGDETEDGAVSVLYLSKVQPGHYFLVRVVRPGYVAEPDKGGKRRIEETGLWGLTPKQAGTRSSRRCGAAGHDQCAESASSPLVVFVAAAGVARAGD